MNCTMSTPKNASPNIGKVKCPERQATVGSAAPAGRAAARGVTLVEVLIVVAIMSMIAAGVVVAVIPKFKDAQEKTAIQNARELRNAATRWRATRGGDQSPPCPNWCPIRRSIPLRRPMIPGDRCTRFSCADDEIIVTSPGADKKEGTGDDISVPKVATAGH